MEYEDTSEEEKASDEEEQPAALTGSGTEMVTVRANVAVLGLAVGETGAFPISDEEVRANIAAGNLTGDLGPTEG